MTAILAGACVQAPAAPASVPSATATEVPSPTQPPTPFTSNASILSTVEIAKLLRPSVVHIQIETVQTGLPAPQNGVGTGVILDEEGNILTNNHVVDGAQRITVALADGRSIDATLVGGDLFTDLAVIKIEADDLTPAVVGDSSQLQVGEDVVAIGHALDLSGGPTVSKGVVSALERSIQEDAQSTIDGLIQTDAAINPGNSGGPLANSQGEVIGINTAIIRQSQGIGFAININDAKLVFRQLIARGFVERGFLGIVHLNVTPTTASDLGIPVNYGVAIDSVTRGSAADQVGLRANDVIVKLENTEIRTTADLIRFLTNHGPGETVDIDYYRGSQMLEGLVTLGARPGQ